MKRALISVYFKEGIDSLAKKLVDNNWEIMSTGGTAAFLKKNNIPVIEIADLTGFPEILHGRVKTLHPKVFGGILSTSSDSDIKDLQQISTKKIDLVIVNFYPFEETLQETDKSPEEMIEKIDIGGPSMVRAAAKNFKETIVIVDKTDYNPIVDLLLEKGDLNYDERISLSQKAFSYTSFYDSLIGSYLFAGKTGLPNFFNLCGRKLMDLRYGENPHQQGALYIRDNKSPLARMEKIQGKKLSFNNILDLSMVYDLLGYFKNAEETFSVIVKHQNPCGAAIGENQEEAFTKAFDGDSKSAFGGIVGFNTILTANTVQKMKNIFFEVIIAPEFSEGALALLKKKKKLRLIKAELGYLDQYDIKKVPGGFAVQDKDNLLPDSDSFQLKTQKKLTETEKMDVKFGWKIMKFVKSNGIIIVKNQKLIGVGAGQMSRVDAVELAIKKSQSSLTEACLLSDAFFPFPDSIEVAAKAKISLIVQPGGSINDEKVIEAAKVNGISLVFTAVRHFRH
jgi:phosphoribosylaminoimidazolecarboxamide formyltransferase/IMP cyclohydrolase